MTTKNTKKKKKDDFDFKKAVERLEEINRWFQEEDIDLDEGLEKLKEGKKLIGKCQKRLNEAENEFIDVKKELEDISDNDDIDFDSLEDGELFDYEE